MQRALLSLLNFAAVLSLSIKGKSLHPSRASPSVTCLAGFGSKPDAAASTPKKGGAKSKPLPTSAKVPAKVVNKAKVADPQLEEGQRRQTITSTRSVSVDLGKGKSVSVILPTLDDEDDEATLASMSIDSIAAKYGHLTGAGDIVWPAGLAFSRLLAHCPSFVVGKRVLELGSGVGAVGLTAACAGAASVVLTDYDEDVLALSREAASANGVSNIVSAARLDWTKSDELPAGGPFDVVLAADVLYAESNANSIARLLPHLLSTGGRCMIADQTQWPWRADFKAVCAKGGLAVEEMRLPAPEDVRLLTIMRASDVEESE